MRTWDNSHLFNDCDGQRNSWVDNEMNDPCMTLSYTDKFRPSPISHVNGLSISFTTMYWIVLKMKKWISDFREYTCNTHPLLFSSLNLNNALKKNNLWAFSPDQFIIKSESFQSKALSGIDSLTLKLSQMHRVLWTLTFCPIKEY